MFENTLMRSANLMHSEQPPVAVCLHVKVCNVNCLSLLQPNTLQLDSLQLLMWSTYDALIFTKFPYGNFSCLLKNVFNIKKCFYKRISHTIKIWKISSLAKKYFLKNCHPVHAKHESTKWLLYS